jgi:hypothetical protein
MEPRQSFPSWKQALVTFGGGFVLAISACFGFLVTLNINGPSSAINVFAAIMFGVGVIAILVGVVFVLILILRTILDKPKPPAPSPPTLDEPPPDVPS